MLREAKEREEKDKQETLERELRAKRELEWVNAHHMYIYTNTILVYITCTHALTCITTCYWCRVKGWLKYKRKSKRC